MSEQTAISPLDDAMRAPSLFGHASGRIITMSFMVLLLVL